MVKYYQSSAASDTSEKYELLTLREEVGYLELMGFKGKLNIVVLFVVGFILLVVLGYLVYKLQDLKYTKVKIEGDRWVEEMVGSSTYNDSLRLGLRKHPDGSDSVLIIDGILIGKKDDVISVQTETETYSIKVDKELKVLVIDQRLSPSEQLAKLEGIDLADLELGSHVEIGVSRDTAGNLIALTIQHNIF